MEKRKGICLAWREIHVQYILWLAPIISNWMQYDTIRYDTILFIPSAM